MFKYIKVFSKCLYFIIFCLVIIILSSCVYTKKEEKNVNFQVDNTKQTETINEQNNAVIEDDINIDSDIEQKKDNQIENISNIEEKNMEELKKDSIVIIGGFKTPFAMNFDKKGNIYVAEWGSGNNQFVVKKYDKKFNFLNNINGSFIQPHAIDFDVENNIYITEYGGARIQKFSQDGSSLGWLGVVGDGMLSNGYVNETITKGGSKQGLMKGPATTYFDNEYNLLVSDFIAHCIIKFTKEGEFIGWIGAKQSDVLTNGWQKEGSPIKTNLPGGFEDPHVARVDKDNNIYVVDTRNHRIQKFTNTGKFIGWIGAKEDGAITDGWESLGVSADSPLPGGFYNPVALDILENGDFITSENGNHRLQRFSKEGKFISWFGGKENGGVTETWQKEGTSTKGLKPGMFNKPYDIKIHNNKIYIVDTGNNRIQILNL